MTCEDYKIQISASMDGELNDAERVDLMAHVRECESCRHAMAAATQLEKALGMWAEPGVPVPAPAWAAVASRLPQPADFHWQRLALPLAASILALAGGTFMLRQSAVVPVKGIQNVAVCRPLTEEQQLAAQLTQSVLLDSQGKGLDEIAMVVCSRQAIGQAIGVTDL